jgi:sortase A
VTVRVMLAPRRIIRTILLLTGVTCLSYYGWSVLDQNLQQTHESRVFDHAREQVQAEGPAPSPPRVGKGSRASATDSSARPLLSTIGRISVPRLHLRAMVDEGDDDATLSHAVGHVPGTALPGSVGNVAMAGHRDSFFRGFEDLKRNDEIDVETLHGTFRYRVDEFSVVDPANTSVLAPTRGKTLTLITCFPFHYIGPAPRRFIVRATQISEAPSRNARKSAAWRAARSRPESAQCLPGDICGAAALR